MLFDRVTWTFINSFADWFSALGTIAAVITALYLARRDKLIRLKIVVGLRTIAHQGQTLSEGVKGISITITNIGSRTVRITNLHWRIGRLRKTFLHQITDVNPYTSPLPLKLADGEEAHYFLPVDAWEETNADKPFYIGKFPGISSRSLRIMVSTSVGKSFKSEVEKELRQWFLERGRFQKVR